MISFINISKEATSLLLEILEHEKESNYWQQRFEGLDYREDAILRGCFGELKDNNLVVSVSNIDEDMNIQVIFKEKVVLSSLDINTIFIIITK